MDAQRFQKIVKNTPAPRGTAVLWWLGQMGLWVKLGDTVLSVDYFASGLPGRQVPPPVPAEQVTAVDVFLGTHDHADHIDRPAWRVWRETCPDARFVCPALHRDSLINEGIASERLIGLDDGEACRVGDVVIHAVAAAHEFLSPDPASGRHPCLQYVIEGNGVRIYHAGDTLRYEGMLAKLRGLGHIDAAILPINGRDAARYRRGCIGNMTYQEAVDLAGELRPGLVLPGHWDMFANNSEDPAAFADYLDAKYPGLVPCLIPAYASPVVVRAGR